MYAPIQETQNASFQNYKRYSLQDPQQLASTPLYPHPMLSNSQKSRGQVFDKHGPDSSTPRMEFAGMEIINELDELTKTPTGRVQKENLDFLKLFNSKCAICMGDQGSDDYVYLYDNYLNFPFTVHQ